MAMLSKYFSAMLLAAGVSSIGTAYGADIATKSAPEAPTFERVEPARPTWAVQVTPYLWAAGIKGDVSPFGLAPSVSIDKSFSDILEELNIGGFVNVWARYDRFVFSGDVMYVDTTDSQVVGPLPIVGAIRADVDTKEFNATLLGGYRIYETPRFTLDLLAGARVWHLYTRLTVTVASLSRSFSESFGWVDPLIGARALLRLTDKLSVLAQVDVGGFDVGSHSTWQALATVNYAFADKWSVSAGYKVLDVDYASGGHVFDVTQHGPVVGVTYRF